ncbi:hypothetical protein FH608_034425 [Nonomuraea phyllanthi]|uniref:MDMPI C-terminal domain-containing protein n=1 Tax=Nonomuraea phyllanthi TaxID=2219224 RepID=A0A5C4VXK1_9ACTN|nr:hypothetical protein [Nonomuraea phyllanthi]KAB8190613.1 hypothetical protein FH608_034425 [Nonomuraea phyllanthi]
MSMPHDRPYGWLQRVLTRAPGRGIASPPRRVHSRVPGYLSGPGRRSRSAGCSEGLRRRTKDDSPGAASISGTPHDVLLWMWGRGDGTALTFDGEPELVKRLRDLLKEATQ